MAEEMPVPAGLEAAILDALRAEAEEAPAAAPRPRSDPRGRLAALVLPLASLTAFILLTLTVQLGVSEDAPLAFNLATSILLGLLAAGWTRRGRPGAAGPPLTGALSS